MIWCVEDDASIRDIELYALRSAGLEAEGFTDGAAFWQALQSEKPDLVVLDVMLPGIDGTELLGRMRASTSLRRIPVIMATAKGAEYDRVRALDGGADDYLTKPFLMQELLLRVQHLLQRAYRTELRRSRVLTLGDCTVNLQDAAVRRADGTTLALTATERALLQRLADDRGHIVTYDAVCEAVWGADYYGYENSLNVHIRHLREKIEPDPGHPQWLLTVRGIGYRLTGEV